MMADKKVTLDENGFAVEDGFIDVYNFNAETGEYTGKETEYLAKGVGIPANSCIIEPPETKAGIVPVFNEGKWQEVQDYRGEVVYSIKDGAAITVNKLGDYPEDTTKLAPKTQYDKWNGKKWVEDSESLKIGQIAEAAIKKEVLIQEANDYMNQRQWPGKAAIGRLKGSELEQYGFWLDYLDALSEIDVNLAPDITWPGKP